ncbi:hypothetical protein DM02DRAFT_728043 [Periconia macrospinosa]|uniref:WD40 repeat-like protein n=1 Tax=Periconia macrospinosa TaxID=97972 RepID=A0A2V1DVB7_9PLEO|nr:hypothetical protein DM02DRAFT_728043 [Periconia macrospinosa]
MENVQVSPRYKTTSLSVPSPAASHIAHLSASRLQIRSLSTFEIIRSIALPSTHDLRNSTIAWSPPSRLRTPTPTPTSTPPRRSRSRAPQFASHRFLIADNDNVRVYDLRDEKWNAVVSNGSGSMGKNVHVEFGRDENEVLVWSAFSSRVVRWCLKTGRNIEIRDPKFDGKMGKGWGYRPHKDGSTGDGGGGDEGSGKGNVMAILCRSSGQDILLLLSLPSYSVLKRVELPTTDAQGLKWSGDGRWIAIWDSAATGYFLHIFTADGHLYRTITREPSAELNEWGVEGLGIKTVEWVPGNEWLAVGGWDRRVRILSTRTFTPGVYLDHTAEINVPSAIVYTEAVDATGSRSYGTTPQPAIPPKAMLEKNETGLMKQGISIMAFNKTGTMCATRDDSTPTTVWIWDLISLKPRTILIQHSPVKTLQWHPADASSLLIQTTHDSPTVYLLSAPRLPPSTTTSASTSISAPTLSTTITTSTSSPTHTNPPEIFSLPAPTSTTTTTKKPTSKPKPPLPTSSSFPTRWTARWLATPADKKPALILAHTLTYVVVWPEGKDQILRFENPDGDYDDSDDSLFEILTGRKEVPPLPLLQQEDGEGGSGGDAAYFEDEAEYGEEEEEDLFAAEGEESMGGFEDTFRGKGGAGLGMVRQRGRSVLGESGLDEMF